MAKIMVLVPNQEMADYTHQIVEEEKIESCSVEVIRTSNSVSAARKAIENGAGVIVARGLQADLIHEYTKVPLVEITLTGQEMGLLIEEAKNLSTSDCPNLAFIGHKTMFPDTSYMNEIFHVNLRIYLFKDRNKIEELVKEAIQEGADVVIGGERVQAIMRQYPIPSLFLRAREDSIRKALHVANKVVYTSKIEKENNAQFLTVLDTVYNGVIKINIDKNITTINHAAQQFLGIGEKQILGKSINKIIPALEIDYIDKVLEGKREMFTTSLNIEKSPFMVTIAPIAYDEMITGAIISINKIQTNIKESERSDNLLLGYLTDGDFGKLETKNEIMKQSIELAKIYALSQSPVIIYGETGTEKELFAQGIHNHGYQKNSPYITVNCSGMTEQQQIDSLFGFTMPDGTKKEGALEKASFGTLLIRDIDELSLRCQYRLLRIMRYKIFMKTDIEEIPAMEVRIIATSRNELSDKVKSKKFREDLYYLLNAFSIYIPPLRKRKEDIPAMMQKHLKQYNKKYGKRVLLTKGAIEAASNYSWSGNTLQLERFCEHLVLTAQKRNVDEVLLLNMLKQLYPVIETHQEIKRIVIYEAPEAAKLKEILQKNNWSRQKTAQELNISTSTLWRRMKKYGIIKK